MTYMELSKLKTNGFTTNHVIDDIVSSARFCYTKSAFRKAQVTQHDMAKIQSAADMEKPQLLDEPHSELVFWGGTL